MKKLSLLLFTLIGILIGLLISFFLWEHFEKNKKSGFSAASAPEKLEIIDIDRVVQNCSTKDRKGVHPDGFGGGGFPEILFKNGKLMIGYWGSMENGDVLELKPFDWNENGVDFDYPGAKYALEQAAKSQFLSELNPFYDDGQLFCYPKDEDCAINYELGAWSDEEGNYFVAGSPVESEIWLYEINGNLYDPATFSRKGWLDKAWEGQPADSQRFFGGIKDGKILVKRYRNYRVLLDEEETFVDQHGEHTWLKSDYQLETCEILL